MPHAARMHLATCKIQHAMLAQYHRACAGLRRRDRTYMAARPVYSITRRSASEPDRPNAHTLRGLAAGAPHCRGLRGSRPHWVLHGTAYSASRLHRTAGAAAGYWSVGIQAYVRIRMVPEPVSYAAPVYSVLRLSHSAAPSHFVIRGLSIVLRPARRGEARRGEAGRGEARRGEAAVWS